MAHQLALEAHAHVKNPSGQTHDLYITQIAITLVVLATLAAGAGSLEAVESGRTVTESTAAILAQDKATDAWNEFQAHTLKRHMDDIAADNGSSRFYREGEVEQAAVRKALSEASAAEKERDMRLAESSRHEKRADWLTASATLAEIAIMLATIALITRRQIFWFAAMGSGCMGAILFGMAYLS